MTNEEARQIIATWLVSSKGAKGQRGYIEGWFDEEDVEAFSMAIEALQQERPKGEWIDKGWKGDWQFETDGRGNCWHEYECSKCGFHSKGSKSDFCHNCGAKMVGDNDEK